MPLQVALIGYGGAGCIFQAPLIGGVPGLHLACIVSSHFELAHAVPCPACHATLRIRHNPIR